MKLEFVENMLKKNNWMDSNEVEIEGMEKLEEKREEKK